MIDQIMSLALGHGIWAALFCFLFIYMLKDSRTREKKYISAIETLGEELGNTTSALKVCDEIKSNCSASMAKSIEIKHDTENIKEDTESIRSSLGLL